MAFKIKDRTYEQVFENHENLTMRFYSAVKVYLKMHLTVPRCKALYDHMEDGGKIATFRCRQDYYELMEHTMTSAGIPYLRVITKTGKTGFIIAETDIDRVSKEQKTVLTWRTRYVQVVPCDELGKHNTKISNRATIISGISKAKAYRIKQTIKDRMPYEEIGFDDMNDGTCRIGIYDDDIQKKGIGNATLQKIILSAGLVMNGKDKEKLVKEEEQKADFLHFMEEYKENERIDYDSTPLYVVGSYGQYIRYTGQEIDTGYIVLKDKTPAFQVIQTVSRDVPDYEKIESSLRTRIRMPIATFSLAEALDYGKERLNDQELTLEEKERQIERGKLVERIDKAVHDRISYDEQMGQIREPGEKLIVYEREAGKLIGSLETSEPAKGYGPKEVREKLADEIRASLEKQGVSIKEASKDISNMTLQVKDAHVRFDQSIEEVMRGLEDSGRIPEREEQERS